MPYSHSFFKQDVKVFFEKTLSLDSKILDVGPGLGTYSNLLKPLGFKLDCLEIFAPYILEYDLISKYENVIEGDIRDFDFSNYDFIIMGDVLEHLSIEDSQKILNKIKDNNQECLIAVPYLCEQGIMEDNEHETHLQPELTPELVIKQYPQLDLLVRNEYYGYYINRRGDGNLRWDLDKQEFNSIPQQKLFLDTINEDEVFFTNQTGNEIDVDIIVTSDAGTHYTTKLNLAPNVRYFVKVPGKFSNKKISFESEIINKHYWMN